MAKKKPKGPKGPLDARSLQGEENHAWSPRRIRDWLKMGYTREEIGEAIRRAVAEISAEHKAAGATTA